MKILVKAKPSSKHPFIRQESDGVYTVAVKEPAVDNKANKAIRKLLANYFSVALSNVILMQGITIRKKVFEIKNV